MIPPNLFADIPAETARGTLHHAPPRRRSSRRADRLPGPASPAGFWYDEAEAEWVLVLEGNAIIELEGDGPPLALTEVGHQHRRKRHQSRPRLALRDAGGQRLAHVVSPQQGHVIISRAGAFFKAKNWARAGACLSEQKDSLALFPPLAGNISDALFPPASTGRHAVWFLCRIVSQGPFPPLPPRCAWRHTIARGARLRRAHSALGSPAHPSTPAARSKTRSLAGKASGSPSARIAT